MPEKWLVLCSSSGSPVLVTPAGGAILSPGLTGAVAGGLAGVIGLMVLEVRCPNLSGYHILVWHWGVALLAMLGGLTLGRLSNRRT